MLLYENFINLLAYTESKRKQSLVTEGKKKSCLAQLLDVCQIYFHCYFFSPKLRKKLHSLIISFKEIILKKPEENWKILLGKNSTLNDNLTSTQYKTKSYLKSS